MAPKKNYTPDQMRRAVEAVRKGEKVAVAAKQYGVPRITLHDKITGKTALNCSMGPRTILSKLQEDVLERWILAMADKHYPITRECLLDSVQKIITDQKIPNPFTNNRPGKKWFYSFLKRRPALTEKVAENLSRARDNVSENEIKMWFAEIKTYLEQNSLMDVVRDPNRCFNADETAFFLSPKQGRVLAKKGEKHLYSSSGDDKENLTVLFTGNAAGLLAPPMIVFAYERTPKHISDSVDETWGIGKSETGWMCSNTFYEYITNVFNPWLEEKGIQKPILFFVDGHKSHLTLHLSNYCAENGIELIALYPNSTHILQPMDIAVFRPLKLFWKNAVHEWQMENLGQNIRKEKFAPVLKKAIQKLNPDCLKNGFRAGGICPFGPEYIDMSKIKNRGKTSDFSSKPASTEFLKCLEKEIVKVFSAEKLSLFNKFYYEDRKTVENNLPEEDTALYIIWSKSKHDSENDYETNSVTPAVELDSDPENSQNSETTTAASQLSTDNPIDASSKTSQNITETTASPIIPTMQINYPTGCSYVNVENSRISQIISEGTSHPTIDEPPKQITFEPTNIIPIDVQHLSTSQNNPKSLLASNTLSETTAAPVMTILPKSVPTIDSSLDLENCVTSKNISQIKSRLPISEPPKQTTAEPANIIPTDIENPSTSQNICGTPATNILSENNYKNDTKTPKKQTIDDTLGVKVPTPFKKFLFWPEGENRTKKRIKREKIPSAVTGKAWRDYHEYKEKQKKKEQEEKEERAKRKQEKKLMKEKAAEEKRKKSNLKQKRKAQVKSSSDESNFEIEYAESDDSYIGDEDVESEVEYQRLTTQNDQKSNGHLSKGLSKRRRMQSPERGTDSDMDIPLNMLSSKKIRSINKGSYVIVMYENEYFPGKVEDEKEKQYEVSTMVLSTGNTFRWPEKTDKIWYNRSQVIEKINEPICLNKRGFYKIPEMDKYLPDIYN